MGGDGDPGTNPEQLFATSYAACFLSAVHYVAQRRRLAVAEESAVTASVGIGMREDCAGFGLQVHLSISLPGLEPSLAAELALEAHKVCPYSHMARHGADISVNVRD